MSDIETIAFLMARVESQDQQITRLEAFLRAEQRRNQILMDTNLRLNDELKAAEACVARRDDLI